MRLWLAMAAGKLVRAALKLLGRNATQMPGVIALKICPDILERMPKPERIIAVTGTNGKTTVTNLIAQALTNTGRKVVSNSKGANIQTGVIAALLTCDTLSGRCKADIGVIECDERSSRLLYPYLKPELIAVTDLFRDSMRRNPHPEYIRDFINSALPAESRLLLNADDPISNQLGPANQKRYYSFDRQDFEPAARNNIVNDARICPVCHKPLVWDMRRYHNIGTVHCENCGYHSPAADYRLVKADPVSQTGRLVYDGKSMDIPLCDMAVYNIYDSLLAACALLEFGLTPAETAASLAGLKVVASRLQHGTACGRPITALMAKGLNPVAVSRCLEQIADTAGTKTVIMTFDDTFYEKVGSENISWAYDVDYEFLTGADISQIIVYGPRYQDNKLRLLIAGIDEAKIIAVRNMDEAAAAFRPELCDKIFIMFDLFRVGELPALIEKLDRHNTGGGQK